MAERELYPAGTFSWVELVTGDAQAAKAFYGDLFGWDYDDQEIPGGGEYTMVHKNDREVAGLFADKAQPPHWNNYVTVDSADDAAAKAQELGGTVVAPAFDVMDAGRMAVLEDPTGAFFCVWQAKQHPGARRINEPGAFTWNDLTTPDVATAADFYRGLFGWRIEDIPGSGGYHVIYVGDRSNGGLSSFGSEQAPPSWTPYFGTDDVDAAAARVQELGGRVLVPRQEMPQGAFAVVADAQGAVFALWSGDYDD
jgi:predicted enzyme related to lactoylglutathione lyase